jgi:hypothetical protein
MKHQDTLEQHEAAAHELIAALGRLSHEVQAPPDFVARVLAQAAPRPTPPPGPLAWLGRLPWGVEVAVAAVVVLAVVGAVPQYLTWLHTYVQGLPAQTVPRSEETSPRTKGLGQDRVAPAVPLGSWEINASGDRGQLAILTVDRQGELRGTLYGQAIVGFWDERAQKILFVRFLDPAVPATTQVYTGYLFRNSGGVRGVGTATYTLAGSFEAFGGTGATAARAVYGWYAQQGVTE